MKTLNLSEYRKMTDSEFILLMRRVFAIFRHV